MIKLLLLSAGTNANYHIARILKEKFNKDFYIIGADINEQYLIPTGLYIDKFYKVPCSSSLYFYNEILKICKNEKVNFLIPSFDVDQKIFFPENEDLIKLGVISLGTSKDTLPMYENKAKMNEFLQSIGLPVPKNYSLSQCEDNQLYMVKPINGVGSIGAALRTTKDMKSLNISDFIIQERCSEPEVTMECFWFNGTISTICRERITTKAGVCTKARIFKDKKLENIAVKFAKSLKVPHIFNLQFMKNQKDEYVITDVNLRTAGGMSLSYAAGWDEVSALAKIMINKSDNRDIFETLPSFVAEKYVVRAYTDIVTKIEKKVIAFDWDGTLLDSRKRHIAVLDFVLKKFNVFLDTSNLVEFKSLGKNNIDFLVANGIEENLAKNIQKEWIENIERQDFLSLDILYPDTIEILKKFSIDYDLILITARSNKELTMKQITENGVLPFFKEVFVVQSNENTAKAKAEILKSQNALYIVGDTIVDAEASKIAGVGFKFRENGFHKKEKIADIIKV